MLRGQSKNPARHATTYPYEQMWQLQDTRCCLDVAEPKQEWSDPDMPQLAEFEVPSSLRVTKVHRLDQWVAAGDQISVTWGGLEMDKNEISITAVRDNIRSTREILGTSGIEACC